ncbi:hypothetical protein ACH5RR_012035, partial [Cinchona calisaya]
YIKEIISVIFVAKGKKQSSILCLIVLWPRMCREIPWYSGKDLTEIDIISGTERCVKLNTSTILGAHKRKESSAFATRDHEGRLIVVRGWLNQNVKVKNLLEAETILLALQFAKDEGWRNVEVQAECAHLVNELKRKNSRDKELELLLDDIICLSDWFCKCSFTFFV